MTIAHLPEHASRVRRGHLAALVSQIPSDRLAVAEELLADIIAHEEVDGRGLTTAELSALDRLGVSESDLLEPTSLSATARGRLQNLRLERQSYTVAEAAAILGVTAARVRQRCTDGSLLAQRQSGGWRISALQFPGGRPLHGWAHVAPAIPSDTPLTVVERALNSPSMRLHMDDEELTPAQWLSRGGDPALAADALSDALDRLP